MTPERPKAVSLREAAERVIEQSRHEVFMDNRKRVSVENWCALRDALAADAEERKETVAVLRELEWSHLLDDIRLGNVVGQEPGCPACFRERNLGHHPNCRLSAILHRLEPQ